MRAIPWLVGALLLACYSYFFYLGGDWNINTRLDLVRAIADEGTFAIDSYHRNTGDKAYYGGHYYCDKAPGVSLLGIPPYLALSPAGAALTGRGHAAAVFLTPYAISFFTTALPSALVGVLLYFLLGEIVPDPRGRIWGTLAYALGTLAFPYSTIMFGHQTAAALILAAFFLLFRLRKRGFRFAWAALAGLAGGYAVITDYLAALPFVALSLYAGWLAGTSPEQPWRARRAGAGLLAWALGAAAPVLFLLYYHAVCFGSPFSLGHTHEANPLFAQEWSQGFLGLTGPNATAAYQMTIGPLMGIFYSSPFLLLAFPGLWWMCKRAGLKAEALVCVSVALGGILLISSWSIWYDGPVFGARYLIVYLPFLALPAAVSFTKLPTLFKALAALSILSMAMVTATSPMITASVWSPVNPSGLKNPLLEYHYPRFIAMLIQPKARLQLGPNLMMFLGEEGLLSLLPLVAIAVLCLAAIAWAGRPRAAGPKQPG